MYYSKCSHVHMYVKHVCVRVDYPFNSAVFLLYLRIPRGAGAEWDPWLMKW